MQQEMEWEQALERLKQWEEYDVPDITALLAGARSVEDEWMDNNDPESNPQG